MQDTKMPSFPPSLIILTRQQAQMADAYACQHHRIASIDLMNQASVHIAEHAEQMLHHSTKKRVLVLIGPGNNGGDGFATAIRLKQKGIDVTCLTTTSQHKGDAARMAERWQGTTAPITSIVKHKAQLADSLLIDGLFGIGLTRPLNHELCHIIDSIHAAALLVLAIDIPSGIDCDSGQILRSTPGPVLTAARTITFFGKKPAHLLSPSKAFCGDVIVASLTPHASQHFDCLTHVHSQPPRLVHNHPLLWQDMLSKPRSHDHKYTRGACAFFAGAMSGATRLAILAAAESGIGIIHVAAEPAMQMPTDSVLRETHEWTELLCDTRIKAYAIGQGLAIRVDEQRQIITALTLLAERDDNPILILDGGALCPSIMRRLADRKPSYQLILTPHAGEARRCFPTLASSPYWRYAQAIAQAMQATVLLKGPATIIASPHPSMVYINTHAPASLARAGSGDLLTGIIAALSAQTHHPILACAAAAYIHGEAAYLAEHHHQTRAAHMPPYIRQTLAQLQ